MREPETAQHPLILPLAAVAAFATAWLVVVRLGLFDWSMPMFAKVSLGVMGLHVVWLVVLTAILTKPFIGIIRTMTISLFLVVAAATAISLFGMSFTNVRAGADYVVLTMSAAVVVSFVVAVINRYGRLRMLSKLAEEVVFVMVPPLGLVFLVLGTIFIGVATPTEGGAMGAAGAMLLAILKGRLSFDLTRQAAESTAKLSAFVVFILIGARVFSLTFYGWMVTAG